MGEENAVLTTILRTQILLPVQLESMIEVLILLMTGPNNALQLPIEQAHYHI